MLTILIYVVDTLRRVLRKLGYTVWILFDCFREAQDIRRKTPRLHVDD
jgi:hypothetical protein